MVSYHRYLEIREVQIEVDSPEADLRNSRRILIEPMFCQGPTPQTILSDAMQEHERRTETLNLADAFRALEMNGFFSDLLLSQNT